MVSKSKISNFFHSQFANINTDSITVQGGAVKGYPYDDFEYGLTIGAYRSILNFYLVFRDQFPAETREVFDVYAQQFFTCCDHAEADQPILYPPAS